MEVGIERLVALSCFVIGLSHIVQPRAWAKLFSDWLSKGTTGVFYTGLLHFNIGSLVVAFHNVWSGLPMIVTLLGWAWTLKGVFYLTCPTFAMKSVRRVSTERAYEFLIAGAVLVIIALVIAYSLFTRGVLWS